MNNLLNNKWITVIITKLQVVPVELDVSSESSCAVRLARHSQNAWAWHVERVESSRAKWNLSLNQLFDSCVNALTNYELRWNGPLPALYISPLLHPTHLHARPRWAAQGTRPRYAGGWSVGRCGINFLRYSGAQIHSLGRCAFQAVGSYMRHSGNHLQLSGHSWRRPVTS